MSICGMSTKRDISSLARLALVGAIVLAGGCQTAPTARDMHGNPLAAGEHLPGERWDAPDVAGRARTMVVVPFTAAPQLRTRANIAQLESAAVIASEELVRDLRRSGHLDQVGLGDGSEGADLVVRGRVLDYVPPNQATDRLGTGKQSLEVALDITSGDRAVASLFTREGNPNRRWYDSEEKDLHALARNAGTRLAAVITTAVATDR